MDLTLEKLIGILDAKKSERNSISNKIEELVDKEILYFQNKKNLTDIINLLEKYGFNPEFQQNINEKETIDKRDYFLELVSNFKKIEDNSFLNLYEKYSNQESYKAAEALLKESKNEIENLKSSLFQSSGEDNKNRSFITIKKLIDHKFNMIEEQNYMINSLIYYFYCLPEEVISQLEKGEPEKLKIENKEKIKSFFGNKNDKEEKVVRRQEICRDIIVKYLKESQNTEQIQKKNELKNNKLTLIKENKISSGKDETTKNEDLFLKDVVNLRMEDLIILSKYNYEE